MESIPKNKSIDQDLEPFIKTDERPATSRDQLLDEFDNLLATHQLDNKISKRYLLRIRLPRLIGGILALALCIGAVILVLLPPTSHDHGMKYILAAGMMITGVYLGIRFAL